MADRQDPRVGPNIEAVRTVAVSPTNSPYDVLPDVVGGVRDAQAREAAAVTTAASISSPIVARRARWWCGPTLRCSARSTIVDGRRHRAALTPRSPSPVDLMADKTGARRRGCPTGPPAPYACCPVCSARTAAALPVAVPEQRRGPGHRRHPRLVRRRLRPGRPGHGSATRATPPPSGRFEQPAHPDLTRGRGSCSGPNLGRFPQNVKFTPDFPRSAELVPGDVERTSTAARSTASSRPTRSHCRYLLAGTGPVAWTGRTATSRPTTPYSCCSQRRVRRDPGPGPAERLLQTAARRVVFDAVASGAVTPGRCSTGWSARPRSGGCWCGRRRGGAAAAGPHRGQRAAARPTGRRAGRRGLPQRRARLQDRATTSAQRRRVADPVRGGPAVPPRDHARPGAPPPRPTLRRSATTSRPPASAHRAAPSAPTSTSTPRSVATSRRSWSTGSRWTSAALEHDGREVATLQHPRCDAVSPGDRSEAPGAARGRRRPAGGAGPCCAPHPVRLSDNGFGAIDWRPCSEPS